MQAVYEVHETKPEGFQALVHVAACYLEFDGRLLMLQLSSHKVEAGRWSVPSGKVEENETPIIAAKRELFEETGIFIENESKVLPLRSLYVRKPEIDYVYHPFKIQLDTIPTVRLSEEHQNYKWATAKELEELPLIAAAKEVLNKYRSGSTKKRAAAVVSAYLVLKQEDKVLLGMRKNTGYGDGMWGLPAGHVEDAEAATSAMIREANEELGIKISRDKIKVVHVMHARTNRLNIAIFFECQTWEGKIQNIEPEKCEKLAFFPLDALPPEIIPHQADALNAIARKEFYSEYGF